MPDVTTAPDEPRRPRDEFNQQPEPKVEPKPDIATAEELEGLYKSLAEPHVQGSDLTYGGPVEQASHTDVEDKKLARVRDLEQRLNAKRGNFRGR